MNTRELISLAEDYGYGISKNGAEGYTLSYSDGGVIHRVSMRIAGQKPMNLQAVAKWIANNPRPNSSVDKFLKSGGAPVDGAVTFEINGKGYSTDEATLNVLRQVIQPARKSNDYSAVIAVIELGKLTGRIKEL